MRARSNTQGSNATEPAGPSKTNYAMYESMLTSCLQKILKTVPRKCKELRDLCGEALEQVKNDANDEVLSANKYFRIMKLALDTKNTRLTEHILYNVQKLIAHGMLDGNHPDDCLYPEDERPRSNGLLPRKLIDAIVDEVCKCTAERDQQVQLQVVRALLTLVATRKTEVHEKSLLKVLTSLYFIHIACTNPVNQSTARASLIQMIKIVFNKMEQHETSKKLNTNHNLSTGATRAEHSSSGLAVTEDASDQDLKFKSEREEPKTFFTANEQYAQVTLTFMIDNVCLHAAKQDEIRGHHLKIIGDYEEAGDGAAAQKQRELMAEELGNLGMICVPKLNNKKKKKNDEEKAERDKQDVVVFNEQNIPAGKFGWCVACRNTANLYCKHTRHPVCSFECKQAHIKMLEEAHEQVEEEESKSSRMTQPAMEDPQAQQHTKDALLVFNKLCQLLQNPDLGHKPDNVYDVRKVMLGLDLIHSCLENPGQTFTQRKEFVNVVRDQLCNALLKFAVSSEHKIFARTISIFHCLFLHFREHLKQSIGVFLDNFFLRMLDSGNSEYDYKYSILEFFDKLAENPEHVLEIFANFDCDVSGLDICYRIINTISKMAKSELNRDQASVITPQQEQSMRRQALEILVKILRNLNRTIETTQEMEAQARQRLAERREQIAIQEEEEQLNEPSEHMDAKLQMQNLVYKQDMNTAAKKFNLKAKNGIKFLQDKGYIKTEPQEEVIKGLTRFLKEVPTLSPTEIGKFIGEKKPFNEEVLSWYIEEFDWSGEETDLIDAMKELMTGFRIPGEGQIVDRILEKFGEKIAKDQPDMFGNAEGVFLFSYAVLMVQTSIHNPQAKKCRMSLADFKKITSTVKLSNTKDIDMDEYREKIYERVEREPFTLEEDEEARMKLEAQTNTNKKQLFDKEREYIMRRGKNILKKTSDKNQFVLIRDTSTIKPMFEQTKDAYLAVFSYVLEQTDDPVVSGLCLQGFVHAIKISGHYSINDICNLFVSSLSKFTLVNAQREIRVKNINCIRGLLNLAIKDGEILGESWRHVLECLSKIDSMRALGLGETTDAEFFQQENAVIHSQNQQLLLRNSAIIAEQIDANQIEQVFLQSEKLNTNAIIDFIENLCKVSKDELLDEDNPKKFSLQKIVEVASLNMDRVRFQWQNIWQTLGDHFTWVGSHKNLNVVIYAIDSLRQLADKFLEKEERKNFSYQKMFLKPFETIMLTNLHNTQKEIKEYVVMCISALCNQKAKYIRSGWEVILNIFSLAAQDTTERHLVDQSFRSIEHAIQNHFNLLEENFVELVNCLSKFARNGTSEQTAKVLVLLQGCAKYLRDKPDIITNLISSQGQQLQQKFLEERQRSANQAYGIQSAHELSLQKQVPGSNEKDIKMSVMQELQDQKFAETHLRNFQFKELWFPILRNFTALMMDKNEQIRSTALTSFIQTLQDYQAQSEGLWREIFGQVLYPMLNDISLQVEVLRKKQSTNNENQIEVCVRYVDSILCELNNFFEHYAESLGPSLMACYFDVLNLYVSKLNIKELSNIVLQRVIDLLLRIGNTMRQYPQFWSDINEQIRLLYDQSRPKLLIEEMENFQQSQNGELLCLKDKNKKTDSKFEQSYSKCTVQLKLAELIAAFVLEYFECIEETQIQILLQQLEEQYKFAIEFNSEMNLRQALKNAGYSQNKEPLPSLLKLEQQSLKAFLLILFGKFQKTGQSQQVLFGQCSKVLKDYVLKHNELSSINDEQGKLRADELKRQIDSLSPIVADVILVNLLKLTDNQVKGLSGDMGQLMLDLTLCDNRYVRQVNHKLLTRMFEQMQTKK